MLTKERIIYFGIALLSAGIVCLSYMSGLFAGPESSLEDTLFSARPISPQVVIVTVDDRSINEIGQWPWPRATFAKLFDALAAYQPQAVGVDILFTEASRLGAADDATGKEIAGVGPHGQRVAVEIDVAVDVEHRDLLVRHELGGGRGVHVEHARRSGVGPALRGFLRGARHRKPDGEGQNTQSTERDESSLHGFKHWRQGKQRADRRGGLTGEETHRSSPMAGGPAFVAECEMATWRGP